MYDPVRAEHTIKEELAPKENLKIKIGIHFFPLKFEKTTHRSSVERTDTSQSCHHIQCIW